MLKNILMLKTENVYYYVALLLLSCKRFLTLLSQQNGEATKKPRHIRMVAFAHSTFLHGYVLNPSSLQYIYIIYIHIYLYTISCHHHTTRISFNRNKVKRKENRFNVKRVYKVCIHQVKLLWRIWGVVK